MSDELKCPICGDWVMGCLCEWEDIATKCHALLATRPECECAKWPKVGSEWKNRDAKEPRVVDAVVPVVEFRERTGARGQYHTSLNDFLSRYEPIPPGPDLAAIACEIANFTAQTISTDVIKAQTEAILRKHFGESKQG